MPKITLLNIDIPSSAPIQVKWCESFWSKFLGLMFKEQLQENEGLLIVNQNESIINSSIHMFFMRFDICVVWINSQFEVVDMRDARRWQPFLFPQKPAKYVLELNDNMSDRITIGTRFHIDYA
jgi:uncharacterized protein